MSPYVNTEWRKWIDTNLGRGCSIGSLIDQMVRNGFDRDVAKAAVLTIGLPNEENAHPPAFEQDPSRIPVGNVVNLPDGPVRVLLRVSQPDVVLIDSFLTARECDELMAEATPSLQPSTVVNMQNGGRQFHEARTSHGMAFRRGASTLLRRVESRIAALVDLPVERGEGIQVLKYGIGAEYRPHYDYFPEEQAGSKEHLKKGGQRIATAIMYLNDVEDGGETVFPEISLHIKPRKGALLYFSYRNALGKNDPRSLHGGAPVLRGEKWIATKWLRELCHED